MNQSVIIMSTVLVLRFIHSFSIRILLFFQRHNILTFGITVGNKATNPDVFNSLVKIRLSKECEYLSAYENSHLRLSIFYQCSF